ncbi:RecQ family ATP-dependent DNA helicase [Oceanobacillus chungangensis]|uniref:ATP-dependent DNA helicase n=1 Tax=Oceanobacillus chungangensis TaxID=1229152 RepID=A0A3D8Q1B7_9BACI|nr:RecQ family ATP-dependent DNA helicase [Oceanobacillus chungangensis]RDW22023.1 ATP-dependent DNA helicase [Oceanobacillus chungangensis]
MNQQITLEQELNKYFNYSSFRLGQKEIIEDILQGKDVLGILPTGSGKSICYQLPAMLLEGVTIVVSPLISLMIDQVKQLKAMQIKQVIALNSFMDPADRKMIYNNIHLYKLIYISPELLQQKELIRLLQQTRISLFVIDEAHCISQWGHEFRPDYLKLNTIIEKLNHPRTLALSATATPDVQQDIIHSLNKPRMVKHIYPMDRTNLTFCIEEVTDEKEKTDQLIQLLNTYYVPTIIYFSSRMVSENVAKLLSEKLPNRNIAFYHGGMEQMDRITIQQQFMNDQLDVICCTSAFGMGINKGNIRFVIHYHLPLQLESYIQEVGRAGRDGKSSVCLLLFSNNDFYIPLNLIKNELPSEEMLSSIFQYLYRLFTERRGLPTKDAEIENLFQLNEIQWRFLRYQFEKHGMIAGNRINFHEENWKQNYQEIEQLIKDRTSIKEKKLNEILQWVHDKGCLRKSLYKSFQPFYSEVKEKCCSNCGFSWSEWNPAKTNIRLDEETNWESKLRKLLLVEENEKF